MSRRKPDTELFVDLVPHHRYRAARYEDWRYATEDDAKKYGGAIRLDWLIVPETAIKADFSKLEGFGYGAAAFYVDHLRQCKDCDRPFVFFAREQRHWYEELGFYAGVGGWRCYECRRAHQLLARRRKVYADYANCFPTAFRDISEFLSATLALWEAEELVDEQKLRRIVKRAKAEAPTLEATMQLVAIVERLNSHSKPTIDREPDA